jgi:hypothetical protein
MLIIYGDIFKRHWPARLAFSSAFNYIKTKKYDLNARGRQPRAIKERFTAAAFWRDINLGSMTSLVLCKNKENKKNKQ